MYPMIYYSHPIAGEAGSGGGGRNFDAQYEKNNCWTAIENVKWLRWHFSQVRWYCPGEVELPILVARQLGFLTVQQALEVDFHIIRTESSGGLVHRWEGSYGTIVEEKLIKELDYPNLLITLPKNLHLCDANMRRQIGDLVDLAVKKSEEQGR